MGYFTLHLPTSTLKLKVHVSICCGLVADLLYNKSATSPQQIEQVELKTQKYENENTKK